MPVLEAISSIFHKDSRCSYTLGFQTEGYRKELPPPNVLIIVLRMSVKNDFFNYRVLVTTVVIKGVLAISLRKN
jgi:hypothetical protein